METEIWKDVIGYEGLYQISNLGRLKSLSCHLHTKRMYRVKHGKILKCKNDKGYIRGRIIKDKIQKMKFIHRLVAEAFIPNPENKPFINHKDGVKNNNVYLNLEWCTQSENYFHAKNVLKRKMGNFKK